MSVLFSPLLNWLCRHLACVRWGVCGLKAGHTRYELHHVIAANLCIDTHLPHASLTCTTAIRVHPIALMLLIVLSATTASLTEVLDSKGYVPPSAREAAVPPQTITGVASIAATSASGPVTADR
eukprot:1347425-Rhodomonas_salina.2